MPDAPAPKPLTGAERVAKRHQRLRDAGLIQLRVWVRPEDADAVRAYDRQAEVRA